MGTHINTLLYTDLFRCETLYSFSSAGSPSFLSETCIGCDISQCALTKKKKPQQKEEKEEI